MRWKHWQWHVCGVRSETNLVGEGERTASAVEMEVGMKVEMEVAMEVAMVTGVRCRAAARVRMAKEPTSELVRGCVPDWDRMKEYGGGESRRKK